MLESEQVAGISANAEKRHVLSQVRTLCTVFVVVQRHTCLLMHGAACVLETIVFQFAMHLR